MTNSTMNEIWVCEKCKSMVDNQTPNHIIEIKSAFNTNGYMTYLSITKECDGNSFQVVPLSHLTSLQNQRDQLVEAKEEAYKILSDERYRGNGYEQTDATKWLAKWYNET